jgi:lipoate-protein ligase A
MAERWWWLETGRGEPGWNMALDEALLVTAEAHGVGVVRVYGWGEPAATFGYSQRYGEVQGLTALRPLIRRPTGGGVVPHDHDWTYSVTVPPGDLWHGMRARDSYRRVHRWVAGAFRRVGVQASLSPARRLAVPGACFAGAEADDVLWGGRKVAGAAQRRSRLGLLIQGSIQPGDLTVERSSFERALRAEGEVEWGGIWESAEVPDLVRNVAAELVQAKYGRESYHHAR